MSPYRRLVTALAIGATALALAAPSALARVNLEPYAQSPGVPYKTVSVQPQADRPVVVRTVESSGFDWGAAAAGAGIAAALLLLGVAAVGVRRRHVVHLAS